jgi:sugar lactone lactonase YvrE
MAADAAGNLYVADQGSIIRKITPAGTVSTFIGLVDGKPLFTRIDAMAADAAGNLYVADCYAIKKVSPSGEISLLAGQAREQGWVDGAGAAARFNYFDSMVVDSSGNLFVIDGNNCIVRKVTAAGGVSTWVGQAGTSGNADGTGTAAQFRFPSSLVIDATDNLYLADIGNGVVRKVTPAGVV